MHRRAVVGPLRPSPVPFQSVVAIGIVALLLLSASALPPARSSPGVVPPSTFSMTTTAAAAEAAKGRRLRRRLRPYDPSNANDVASLDEICRDVYGGSDYLPGAAAGYAADPACSLLALFEEEEDAGDGEGDGEGDGDGKEKGGGGEGEARMVAIGNLKRLPSQGCAWIEAVRVHPARRSRGLCTTLVRSLVDLARSEDGDGGGRTTKTTDVLTCTVRSNRGMLRSLEKVGFAERNVLPMLRFDALRELPGWAADSDEEPRPLLDALGLDRLVSPAARAVDPSSWRTISTEDELIEELGRCRSRGGCSGYLPGLYEYIVPGPNRVDLKRSMERGLVLALDVATGREASGGRDAEDDDAAGTGHAVLVLTQDERISRLKSKWVCSIVAYTRVAFEAALRHAHSVEVSDRMGSVRREERGTSRVRSASAAPPFFLAFDDAVPIEPGTLAHALPRVTDECVVLSYQRRDD